MNIFYGWENYVERLTANWCRVVTDEDTVIIPGDISWALKLEESLEDFKFLDSLPGKKVIIKGNHDLWWGTMTKLLEFFNKNSIKTVTPLFNSFVLAEGFAICGSRGWLYDNSADNKKIVLREAARLETSIKNATEQGFTPIVFMHYPPVYADAYSPEIIEILKKYNIKTVYHGHIHGSGLHRAVAEYENINFKLVSCDCIEFTPYKIVAKNDL
jgi:predicted phosphohydrolase